VAFGPPHANLHHYWDADSVRMAVAAWRKQKPGTAAGLPALAKALVNDPSLPKLDFPEGADTMALAALWAGEGTQLAQEAHERLVFSKFLPDPKGKVIIAVTATAAAKGYDEWATTKAQEQILRAGLRLAWLIEHALPAK
jgi:hypothetical protein